MNISNLKKQAESGNVTAQSILGICYLEGTDVDTDYKEAFRLLHAAASKGAPRACVNLAKMYARGLGIPKNLPEALRLYEQAAKAGEFFAQIELGRHYSRGIGVPVDHHIALKWYTNAAAQQGRISDCEELHEAKNYMEQ